MAAAAWTLTRFNARLYGLKQLPALAIRHISAKIDVYSTADAICVLWALAHFKRTLPGGLRCAVGAVGGCRGRHECRGCSKCRDCSGCSGCSQCASGPIQTAERHVLAHVRAVGHGAHGWFAPMHQC